MADTLDEFAVALRTDTPGSIWVCDVCGASGPARDAPSCSAPDHNGPWTRYRPDLISTLTEPRCRGGFTQRCVETAGHDGKCRPQDVYWRQALEAVEWSGPGNAGRATCPLCSSLKPADQGAVRHKPDCLIGLALG